MMNSSLSTTPNMSTETEYKPYSYQCTSAGTLQSLLANSGHAHYMQDTCQQVEGSTANASSTAVSMSSYLGSQQNDVMMTSIGAAVSYPSMAGGLHDVKPTSFALYSTHASAMFGVPSPPKAVPVPVSDPVDIYINGAASTCSTALTNHDSALANTDTTPMTSQESS